MSNLILKVRKITQSKSSVTSDDSVINALVQGARYTISGLPADKLWFASRDSGVTHAAGITINSPKILAVRRGKHVAHEIPHHLAYTQSTAIETTSYHKASNLFPAWYKQSGKIYLKPDVNIAELAAGTTDSKGNITYIPIPTTITASSSTWSIGPVEQPAIDYAVALDYAGIAAYHMRKATSMLTTILAEVSSKLSSFASAMPTWTSASALSVTTTGVNSAIQSAFNFIYGTTGVGGPVTTGLDNPTVYWLDDEDPEMAIGYIQGAAQELKRADAEVKKQQLAIAEYNAKVQKETGRFNANAVLLQNRIGQIRAVIDKTQIVNSHYQKIQLAQNESNRFFRQADNDLSIIINDGQPITRRKSS